MELLRLLHLVIPPLAPSLLVGISYVDPGKFAAAVEGGSRYGSDLVWLLFSFNAAAILCQYLSARVAIATGEDLAQICSKEYDKVTCIFLGVQAELSMILLDLTMVLGSAHGLNAVFGIDLFTCVFLTIMAAFLFPLVSSLHEQDNARLLCICLALAVLLSYFLGVLMGQPDTSFSSGGIINTLGGESAFVLMGLLGASIMPHNFYLHSSIVQKEQRSADLSKEAACYRHLFVIVCVFSCVFLLNYALMNLGSNVFYSAGLVVLTFQDALSLLDQAYRSSLVPFALVLILFFSNQILALTWNYGRLIVTNEFFKIDIPVWLHYATIRIIVIVPALCCVWSAGAEGLYLLLLFSQVLVALLLPSSVIPLFRVASSRAIMGVCKISYIMEFVALLIFICMIGLKVIFVKEMVFGSSEWASYLRSSVGNTVPVPYVTLLVIASGSFCFMLWLAATPLKSSSSMLDYHVWEQTPVPKSLVEQYQGDVSSSTFLDEPVQMSEPASVMEKSVDSSSTQDASMPIGALNLPDTLLDSEKLPHWTDVENKSELSFSGCSISHSEVVSIGENIIGGPTCNEASDGQLQDAGHLKNERNEIAEKPQKMEGGSHNLKDDDGHSWRPFEVKKEVSESSLTDGPPSFRSLSEKGDENLSGAGSLSRLAGLGRGARRQLTVILDDFWGQLFDFHGQPTPDARAKKLDVLLGLEVKVDGMISVPGKLQSRKDTPGVFSSSGSRTLDSFTHSSMYNSPKQQGLQGYLDASYGGQRDSSSAWSSQFQLLDAYARSSINNNFDVSERRYSSMRIPTTSSGFDQQPATVHGYQLASYINQIAKERGSSSLNGQLDLSALKATPSLLSGYGDSVRRSLAQKPQSSLSSQIPPGFHNVSVARNNNSSQTQRGPYYDLSTPKVADRTLETDNVKKFHSLPDISGLRVPNRDSQDHGNSSQWEKFLSSGHPHSTFEQNYSSTQSRGGGMPVGFSEHSPSKVCRDAFSLQYSSGSGPGSGSGSGSGSGPGPGPGTGSLWSRQPYEQFGVAEKTSGASAQPAGSLQNSYTQETFSAVDPEGKIIQSFRYCVLRLLKLEGSGWLFKQNDGVDEDLMDRVAARERFHYEAETDQTNQPFNADYAKSSLSLSPYCGEGCIYRPDLIVSFGVWCIRRILELSLMESRPELWGKYTYILNRLQGVVDLAFYRPRSPSIPCFCLDIPLEWQQKSNVTASNGSLPPTPTIGRGKLTTGAMMLELIKDVEIAISCRKGRSGTAAGDVAFPKGKENLASVLKRYKRRLSNKPVGTQ